MEESKSGAIRKWLADLWGATSLLSVTLQFHPAAAEIDDCFGDITGIVWRPKETTLEFATACEDGSIRAWRVVEDDEGLSATNRKLLEQH
ncbi:hypothetical protein BGZ90_007499, partial [Linnemannia elongata]